jgi:hypothetical protein
MLGVGGLTRRVEEPLKSPPIPLASDSPLSMTIDPLDPAAIQPVAKVTPQ